MNATDTRSQLLAEVAANPEDDTLRLAFADWLDEQPAGRKACPLDFCRGGYWRHSGDPHTRSTRCHVCGPDGTVPDAADRDRAELIRTQYELATTGGTGVGVKETIAAHMKLCNRERELLAAHPEWSRCRCPRCRGLRGRSSRKLIRGPGVWVSCPACSGTGDLFLRHVDDRTHATEPRTVKFARGFPDAVTCTLAEAFGTDGTPTAWAIEVVRQTPVVRLVLTDAGGPNNNSGDRKYPFYWRDKMFTHPAGYAVADECDKNYRTAERAVDVFAIAAGRVVRRHAHPERK